MNTITTPDPVATDTRRTYVIEYRIGGVWYVAATVMEDDLADLALRTFRRHNPAVEWQKR